MNVKKERAVVFTMSKDLVFAVACVMLNIMNVSRYLADEFVIIHDGIKEKDKEILKSISPCRFITYSFPIEDDSIFNKNTFNHFTKMVFAKFECLKLLDEYKNVMLSDYDIVILDDISELFDKCDSGIKMMPSGSLVRDQLHSPVDDYDMDVEGVCAPVFVLQDHLKNYNKLYKFCYEKLEQYAEHLYLPEQAIFDFMIQEFELDIFPISSEIYCTHPKNNIGNKKVKILHSYGQPKFWNGLHNDIWNKNYKQWVSMGGSKFVEKKLSDKVLCKLKKILGWVK